MTELARRLGTGDAIAIGLGSMIGAGLFAAFAPAAGAAGSGLLIGLALAFVVAFCNAASSAQLAAQYPASGGTYVYGRERLGPWWGFAAGWSFCIGKTASCAAMALTVAAYAVPTGWQRPVGAAVVVALTMVNLRGITRTAALTRLIVAVVLTLLCVVVTGYWFGGHGDTASLRLQGMSAYGVLQSAGLLFFAFAGYARIATLGEEVRDPARTIPRAIVTALGVTAVVYCVVGAGALAVLGPDRLAASHAPLAEAAAASGWAWSEPLVRVAGTAAAAGALLALITGVSRTMLAMARERDLPGTLAAVHPVHRVPHHAELAVGLVVTVAVLLVDLRGVIGFSSFGVLLYYAIANIAAFTQSGEQRRYPRALQLLGLLGCVVLALTLPWQSAAAGAAVVALGCAGRAVRLQR